MGNPLANLNSWALNATASPQLSTIVLGFILFILSFIVYITNERNPKKLRHILRYRWLYAMLIPAGVYYFVFKLLPVLNLRIVFQYYSPTRARNLNVEWLNPLYLNFKEFFTYRDFTMLLKNTLTLAVLNIVFYFPFPIILALLLNEIKHMKFKRVVQSVLYLPHFVSWTVLGSIMLMLLGPSPNGLINSLIKAAGGEEIPFMMSEIWFRPMYILELMWKESGWGTIIYLAALSGVDEQLYEASVIDGAGRFKQLLHITLPCILPTIITLLILRMGSFLDSGFDQIYLMLNSYNRNVATVFDTYVYDVGLTGTITAPSGTTNYSYSATVGVFRSVVSLLLVVGSNALAKLAGEEGVY
ncbi:MAG: sugar ABC transporter permease [Clostridia bacterium]|nr:sugar ABC transporter permease [Clostridia bacterium]